MTTPFSSFKPGVGNTDYPLKINQAMDELDARLPAAGITPLPGGVNLGGPINETQGADIASASTINLEVASGAVDVTGTNAITGITLTAGHERKVRFTAALTLTHGATLQLLTGANIITAAGDYAVFRGYAAGVVRMEDYSRADGTPLIVDGGTY